MSFERKVSTRALYIQVRDHLARQIAKGALKPGSHLPSELELADQLGVSLGTLRKALEALENERLITRRQGRGTFVRDHAVDTRHTFDNLRTKDGQPIPFTVQFLGTTSEARRCRGTGAARDWMGPRWLLDVGRFAITRAPSCSSRSSLAASCFRRLDFAELTGPYRIAALAEEHGVSGGLRIGECGDRSSKRRGQCLVAD